MRRVAPDWLLPQSVRGHIFAVARCFILVTLRPVAKVGATLGPSPTIHNKGAAPSR